MDNNASNDKRYLIQLKKNVDIQRHFAQLREMQIPPSFTVSHIYSPNFLNAYVATLSVDHFPIFQNHADVVCIEEDVEQSICEVTTVNVPSWGLARINTASKLSSTTYTYTYDKAKENGQDVNIYILDTGIYKEHEDFGSRAKDGFVYTGGTKGDKNGHGTHVSGTAAGATYGIAKNATIYEVKVLDDSGIKGMDWVLANAPTGGACIVNMSLSGPYFRSQNDSVQRLTDAGIHVVVAAGNNAKLASGYSPASAPTAIATGSTDSSDTMLEDSNYGKTVRILAPGGSIVSCGIDSRTATATMSGTSMAAPHVTGIIATLISLYGNRSPSDMIKVLQNLGVKGALSGLKSGTPNLLARGSLHSKASFTTEKTKTGSLGIDSGVNANICKDDGMSSKDSKTVSIPADGKTASITFLSTETNTLGNLVIVSADNTITASISHGTEDGASASAKFGGKRNTNTKDHTVSYSDWPVLDG